MPSLVPSLPLVALTLFSLCKNCCSLKQWKESKQRPEGTCFDPLVKVLQTCSQDCEKKNENLMERKEGREWVE